MELDSTKAKDTDGNPLNLPEGAIFTFATEVTPGTGIASYPTIVSTLPVNESSDVSTDILSTTGVSLTFNMLMDHASVRDSQLMLSDLTDDSTPFVFALNSSLVDVTFNDFGTQTIMTVSLATANSFSLLNGHEYQINLKSTSAHKHGESSKTLLYNFRDVRFTF